MLFCTKMTTPPCMCFSLVNLETTVYSINESNDISSQDRKCSEIHKTLYFSWELFRNTSNSPILFFIDHTFWCKMVRLEFGLLLDDEQGNQRVTQSCYLSPITDFKLIREINHLKNNLVGAKKLYQF